MPTHTAGSIMSVRFGVTSRLSEIIMPSCPVAPQGSSAAGLCSAALVPLDYAHYPRSVGQPTRIRRVASAHLPLKTRRHLACEHRGSPCHRSSSHENRCNLLNRFGRPLPLACAPRCCTHNIVSETASCVGGVAWSHNTQRRSRSSLPLSPASTSDVDRAALTAPSRTRRWILLGGGKLTLQPCVFAICIS